MEYTSMNRTRSALLCCALVLALSGCQEQVEEPVLDTTVTVETTAVQTGDLSTQSTYIGTISAEGTASVVAMVSGNVEQVAVSVGDTVTAGDLLCRFDDESARLSLQNAQAAVSSAQESYNSAVANYGGADLPLLQEQLRLAQDNYDDTLALLEIGAASQAEVDQAHQTLLSAQAGVEAARASLNSAQAGIRSAQVGVESAQYQLSLYNLTAPISGVVEAVNVTENNFAASGTAAFVISNGSNKTVTFYVTDSVRQTLTPGQAVTVNYNGQTYEGAVTEIGGVVNAQVGQFQVKAVIDGAQDLPDGLSVELTTTAHQAVGAVLVPSDAMFFENGVAYVYLLQDGTAVRADVTIGLYTEDQVAVTAGLTAGDQVITTWSSTLRDGAAVRLAGQEDQETAPEENAPEDSSAAGSASAPQASASASASSPEAGSEEAEG